MIPRPADHFSVSARDADGIVTVTLDRPNRRNAMSQEMVEGLLDWLASDEAGAARAIILHGRGAGLCAGSDIAMLAAMDDEARGRFERDSGQLAIALSGHAAPVLAAVHGFAIGGGLTLAAAADIVISTEGARWSLPELPIGLFPAWGLEAVAARIGRPAARRLAWGIDTLTGAEAHAIGLVDALAMAPLHTALEMARRLAALPRAQASAVKRYFAPGPEWSAGDALANRLFLNAARSDEGRATFAKFGR